MYVVTFYSFKGGVGRSMSLVNVAAHLAQLQRRVLIIDFDLEAPGIRTFRSLRNPEGDSPGLVDFVTTYLEKGSVPDFREYAYKPALQFGPRGEVWVMPSGKEDSFYGSQLNAIDWGTLYAKHDGYLLFEELKAQWKKHINPDYVLIDSRTGHTDVGGICTRQLPDAVAILFFPSDQNLYGLTDVVSAIKSESKKTSRKKIRLHYVMSNVPDLDDESDIVEQRLAQFRKQLDFSELSATLHHYPSLQLIEQPVFTVERPKSRLTREYVQLANAIMHNNIHDRVGALSFLQNRRATLATEVLSQITAEHSQDNEVLYKLAQVHQRAGRSDEALALLTAAEKYGYRSGDLYVKRAELLHAHGQPLDTIAGDLMTALHSEELSSELLNRAIRLLTELYPEGLRSLPDSRSFNALAIAERLAIASDLAKNRKTITLAGRLLRQLLTNVQDEHELSKIRSPLSLALIALGDFSQAIALLRATTQESQDDLDLADTFNLAMATWAAHREIPAAMFETVVKLVVEKDRSGSFLTGSANFNQCLAISSWAVRNYQAAADYLNLARKIITSHPLPEFSAWRYLTVTPSEFANDLESMEKMFQGDTVLPAFMTGNQLALTRNDDGSTQGAPS